MKSPFAIFRKHQKELMVVLIGLAMFAFVFLDALTQSGGAGTGVLVGVVVGAGLFWMIGSKTGKPTEYAISGALLGALLAFSGSLFGGPAPAVETNIRRWVFLTKNFSDQEIRNLVQRRQTANQFIQDAYSITTENRSAQAPLFGFGHPPEEIERDVFLGELFRYEAEELGIVVSDDMILAYLKQITNGKLSGKLFTKIRNNMGLSEDDVFSLLHDELQARLALQMLAPNILPTPASYWRQFQHLNVRQSLEVAAVPVKAFAGVVKDPADAELFDFFERYKTFPENATGDGAPGFLQPRKVRIAYLEADYDTVENKILAALDEDELAKDIEKFYAENKESLYRNNPIPDDADALDSVDESSPLSPEFTPEKPDAEEPSKTNPDSKQPGNTGKKSGGDNTGKKPDTKNKAEEKKKPNTDQESANDGQARTPDANRLVPNLADGFADVFGSDQLSEVVLVAAVQDAADKKQPADGASNQPPTEVVAPKPDRPPVVAPKPFIPLPEYRPLDDDLRGEIRDLLLNQRTLEEVKELIDKAVKEKMLDLGYKNSRAETTPGKIADRLKSYGNQHGLRYAETSSLSYVELIDSEDHPIGGATEPGVSEFSPTGSLTVADRVFGSQPEQLYQPMQAVDRAVNSRFAFWKIDDEPPRIPLFGEMHIDREIEIDALNKGLGYATSPRRRKFDTVDEFFSAIGQRDLKKTADNKTNRFIWRQFRITIRERDKETGQIVKVRVEEPAIKPQVLEAWKLSKAQPLAKKRAQDLKKKAGDKSLLDGLIDQMIVANGTEELRVRETESFSWLQLPMRDPSNMFAPQVPRLSSISAVESAGGDFMRFVFEQLNEGETGVVPNADKSVYYVVRVTSRQPAVRDQFIRERLFGFSFLPSSYDVLTRQDQQQLAFEWSQRLMDKYAIQWNPTRRRR